MYIQVDAVDIPVQVRCAVCDNLMEINAQYEYGDVVLVEVLACEECKDET